MAPKVSDIERRKIIRYLEQDNSQGWIARKIGRSKQTISRIARDAGFDSDVSSTEKATRASRDYDLAARLEIVNEGFDKARYLLEGISDPRELQSWTVAIGTLIDKRRLEDGQATDRTERVDPERRKRIHGAMDELEYYRRLRSSNTGGAGGG